VANSWPSHALVRQYIKKDFKLPDGTTVVISKLYQCAGTLINRYTILTSAHCIINEFVYENDNATFNVTVEPNRYYPTWESMFRVYLGGHYTLYLPLNPVLPTVRVPIAKIITVMNKNYIFL
jgi:V8-like Glu-specific endopeptidase